MTSHNSTIPGNNGLLAVLSILFLLAWQLPALEVLKGTDIMPLPMHIAMETFAIVVALMVFGITWNTYSSERSANTLILATGFLLVGLLDFGHMFSFKGMPDFVTPSGPEKAIQFWLLERFAVAIILLVVALRVWSLPLRKERTRYLLLILSLALALLGYWQVLFHPEFWPHTFVEGQGLTTFKIAAEYVVIVLLAIAAALFHLQMRRTKDETEARNASRLWMACMASMLGELCFVLYSAVSDIFNLLGHVYKVIGYLFIYRAVFIEGVREPYRRLRDTQQDLQSSRMTLQSILDHTPVRIFWKDREGRYLGANHLFLQDAGFADVQTLTGRNDFDLYPVDQAVRFRSDDLEVMTSARAKTNIEEPIRLQDGKAAWLLTNKVPLYDTAGEVIGVLGAYSDITALREAEQQLAAANQQLRELTVRREQAREEERKRIAQDLHDDLGQMLTGMRMELGVLHLKHSADHPEMGKAIKDLRGQIDDTIQIVRDVAAHLRPAVLDMGVSSALEWQVDEFVKRSGIPCKLTVDRAGDELDVEQATIVFRIVQESLTNIMRHAQATQVEIRLVKGGGCCVLEIEDDGVGFPQAASTRKTFGLMGMRERALVLGGELEIASVPGKGTRITININNCQCRSME